MIKTIDGVTGDMDNLRYNTAIAKLTELNNEVTKVDGPTPRVVADAIVDSVRRRRHRVTVPHSIGVSVARFLRLFLPGVLRFGMRRVDPMREETH